jgi:hypothetical protein
LLLKAPEKSAAPETDAAGIVPDMAVLLEVLALDIIAEREAAVETERKVIAEYRLSERAVREQSLTPESAII